MMNKSEQTIFAFSTTKRIYVWFAIWSLLGLLQTFRLYYAYNVFNPDIISWQKSAIWAFGEWYIWGILSLVIIRVIGWLNDRPIKIKIGSFIGGLIIVPTLHLYLYSVFWVLTKNIYRAEIATSYDSSFDLFIGSFLGKINDNSVAYLLIVAAIYSFTYYSRLFLERNRLAEANRLLAESKLTQLKTQLQPHFLFNTLNTITALIHSDPERADLMTTKLSELLRVSLDDSLKEEISLEAEIELLETYLDIQKIRFEERLQVTIEIDSKSKNVLVPQLILQPIVENGIKHGIATRSEDGHLLIASQIVNQLLVIEIINSGPQLADGFDLENSTGVGLKNSRDRLYHLYGAKGQLVISNFEKSGVKVRLTIPIKNS